MRGDELAAVECLHARTATHRMKCLHQQKQLTRVARQVRASHLILRGLVGMLKFSVLGGGQDSRARDADVARVHAVSISAGTDGEAPATVRERRLGRLVAPMLLCGLALFAAACSGQTTAASNVSSNSATLNAKASCDAGETVSYWLRYQQGSNPFQETPRSQPYTCPSAITDAALKEDVSGLRADTSYTSQFCGTGKDNPTTPVCVDLTGSKARPLRSGHSPLSSSATAPIWCATGEGSSSPAGRCTGW